MFTVVLVDDEPWALMGMLKSFQWEDLGFEVIAKTINPLEAFDIIQKYKPDAVFADIKMPELSGLELLKLCRKNGITSEFIIVSGFAEFSYAKEAIEFGTFYYMLKPVDVEEGKVVLKNLAIYLGEKRAVEKKIKDITILDSIINDGNTLENIIECKYEFYQAVILMFESEIYIEKLCFNEEVRYILLRLTKFKYVILFNCKSDIGSYLKKENLIKDETIKINVGVSTLTNNSKELNDKIGEADLAANNKFIYKKNDIYVYNKPLDNTTLKIIFKEVLNILEQDSSQSIIIKASKIKLIFTNNQLGLEEITFIYNNIIGHINVSEENKECLIEYLSYEEICKEYVDIDELCENICKLFESYYQTKVESNGISKTTNQYFNELLSFINSNYDKELRLHNLADKFHLNPTYICDLFREKMGTTLTKYVEDVRLKISYDLLRNTEIPILQVAERVGYEYFYFNNMFKKKFGITPYKLRKGE